MTEQFEVTSEEILSYARVGWILETYTGGPLTAAEELPLDRRDENGYSEWMISSSEYDERDRAVSTLAFRERKYPEDKNRIVRIEKRCYVEDISDGERQKWHDLAVKGDALKGKKPQEDKSEQE